MMKMEPDSQSKTKARDETLDFRLRSKTECRVSWACSGAPQSSLPAPFPHSPAVVSVLSAFNVVLTSCLTAARRAPPPAHVARYRNSQRPFQTFLAAAPHFIFAHVNVRFFSEEAWPLEKRLRGKLQLCEDPLGEQLPYMGTALGGCLIIHTMSEEP